MFTKSTLFVCVQALLIQNALAAAEGLSWPAANSLVAWDSVIPWAAESPCAASATYATGAAPWSAAPFATIEWGAGYSPGYGVGAQGYRTGITGPAYSYNGLSGPAVMVAGIAGPAFGAAGARFGACEYGVPY